MRNWCVKVENGNISKANRKFWKDCLPFLFLTFCAYGILLSRHYAVDTYVCCRNEQVTIFLQNGRWLGASIFAILNYFGIYGGAIQQLLTFVHIGLLTLSALILTRKPCTGLNIKARVFKEKSGAKECVKRNGRNSLHRHPLLQRAGSLARNRQSAASKNGKSDFQPQNQPGQPGDVRQRRFHGPDVARLFVSCMRRIRCFPV